MTLSSELLVLKGRKRFLDKLYEFIVEKERKKLLLSRIDVRHFQKSVAKAAQQTFEELGFAAELRKIEVEIEFIEYITK